MTEQQSSVLIQRLERLEQEVQRYRRERRWWRLVGSGAVVVLVAVLLVGATGSKVTEEIRARRFVVVDREGKVRAAWGHGVSAWGPSHEDPNYTGLIFYGEEADSRVELGIMETKYRTQEIVGPELYLRKHSGRASLRIGTALTPFGALDNSQLSLSNIDPDKNTEIGVKVNSILAGGTYLSFYKQSFPLAKSPQELLGASRVSLEMDGDGSSRLKLRDKDGQMRAVLGSIDLVEPSTEILTKRPPSSLVLFGEDDKVIWKAP